MGNDILEDVIKDATQKMTKINHSVMTTVKTPKRTYSISISSKGIRITNTIKDDKGKHKSYFVYTWDRIDKIFDD